jgi:UPF0176 protein
MPAILNVAAYRFVAIDDPAAVADRIRELAQARELKGSVLVAPEGINLFLAGPADGLRGLLAELGRDARFADLPAKFSDSELAPFRRLRVRVKREIISFGGRLQGQDGPRAPSVSPRQLRDWLRAGRDDAGRELVLLDTRNRQEVAHGSFASALALPIERFTQLPDALEAHRDALRGKTVVSFCTGGIRCEKAAPWMREAGFGDVLQLEGGILGYFEQVGGEGYEGACFVFDERVALDPALRPVAPMEPAES